MKRWCGSTEDKVYNTKPSVFGVNEPFCSLPYIVLFHSRPAGGDSLGPCEAQHGEPCFKQWRNGWNRFFFFVTDLLLIWRLNIQWAGLKPQRASFGRRAIVILRLLYFQEVSKYLFLLATSRTLECWPVRRVFEPLSGRRPLINKCSLADNEGRAAAVIPLFFFPLLSVQSRKFRFSRLLRFLRTATANLIVSSGAFLTAPSSANVSQFVPLRNDSTLFGSTIDESWASMWKETLFLSPHASSVKGSELVLSGTLSRASWRKYAGLLFFSNAAALAATKKPGGFSK